MKLAIRSGVIIPVLLMIPNVAWYAAHTIAGMGVALAVYYSAWIRFFLGGSTPNLLSASLIGIPSPLASAPIVLLILSAYVLDSWFMFRASVLFGAFHVWASALRS